MSSRKDFRLKRATDVVAQAAPEAPAAELPVFRACDQAATAGIVTEGHPSGCVCQVCVEAVNGSIANAR